MQPKVYTSKGGGALFPPPRTLDRPCLLPLAITVLHRYIRRYLSIYWSILTFCLFRAGLWRFFFLWLFICMIIAPLACTFLTIIFIGCEERFIYVIGQIKDAKVAYNGTCVQGCQMSRLKNKLRIVFFIKIIQQIIFDSCKKRGSNWNGLWIFF